MAGWAETHTHTLDCVEDGQAFEPHPAWLHSSLYISRNTSHPYIYEDAHTHTVWSQYRAVARLADQPKEIPNQKACTSGDAHYSQHWKSIYMRSMCSEEYGDNIYSLVRVPEYKNSLLGGI